MFDIDFINVKLRGWSEDGDRSCGDGVGTGMVFTGMVRDGVQFLSPCRPLVWRRTGHASQT